MSNKADEFVKLITDAAKDFADHHNNCMEVSESNEAEYDQKLDQLNAEFEHFKGLEIPSHLDSITMRSALEGLINKLDRITPQQIETFTNQF